MKILILSILLFLLSCMSYKSNLTHIGILKSDYQLIWSEEFNESRLDANKWNIEIRDPGWVNNELQAYTDKQDNIYIEKNNLVIQGIKESYGTAEYTSGRINTSGKSRWKYGRFEIRAKIPRQKGLWPAIWLLSETIYTDGWPNCGEIDIMEHVNNEDIIYGTIHSEKYNHMNNTQIGGNMIIENMDIEFHTFGLEWNSESLVWFIDNNIYHRIDKKDYFDDKWPFDNNYFLIINQAIGGFWPGDPDSDFRKSQFIIDWIKVYQ